MKKNDYDQPKKRKPFYVASILTPVVGMLLSFFCIWKTHNNILGVVLFLCTIALTTFFSRQSAKTENAWRDTVYSSIDMESLLKTYIDLESFYPDTGFNRDELYQLVPSNDPIGYQISGYNRMNGKWHEYRLQSAWIDYKIKDIDFDGHHSWVSFIKGQLTILDAPIRRFPGRLLIIRSLKSSPKHKEVTKLTYQILLRQTNLTKREITISKAFDEKWKVFTNSENDARIIINVENTFYKKLMSSAKLSFIYFDGGRVFFGGNFILSADGSDINEIKASCEAALESYVEEGLNTIASAALPD